MGASHLAQVRPGRRGQTDLLRGAAGRPLAPDSRRGLSPAGHPDLDQVPDPLGLTLGFVYALFWLFAADRAAGSPTGRLQAAFYAAVGIGIAFPLIWEAANRFEILGATGASIAAGLVAAAGLAVASRRKLLTAAIAAAAGGSLTGLILLRSFEQPEAPLALLLVLGLARSRTPIEKAGG